MSRITEFLLKNICFKSKGVYLLYGLFALGLILAIPMSVLMSGNALTDLENDLMRLADGLKNGVLMPASPDTAGRYILGWCILMFSGICGAGTAIVGISVLLRGFYDGYIAYRLVALLGAGGLGVALVAIVLKELLTLPVYCAMGADASQKSAAVYEFCFGRNEEDEQSASHSEKYTSCGTEEPGDTYKIFRRYIGVCFIYGILMIPGFLYETKGLQFIFNILS